MIFFRYTRQVFIRLVGQVVKTPPSQGGITGSIPVQAVALSKMQVFT